MTEMSLATLALSFLLVHQTPGSGSSACYWDTHKARISNADAGLNYTQTTEFNGSCENFKEKETPYDWETYERNLATPLWRFAYDDTGDDNITLNVTISNIWFHELIIRTEEFSTPKGGNPDCSKIELDKNDVPDRIKVRVLVPSGTRVTIQFVGRGRDGTFFREYSLLVHRPSGEIFTYVDTTYPSKVRLYVEPLPEGVDYYSGELRAETIPGSRKFDPVHTFNLPKKQLFHDAWVDTDGAIHDFRLTPVVNGTHCPSTLTAGFVMLKSHTQLIVVIILSIVILVTTFFILHRLYICYRNRAWRNVKLHLLMIYNSTHPSHIKVVEQLALFLKNCHIDVMIDIWDIDQRHDQNPNLWCDESFAKADIVVVVSSPPEGCYTGPDRPIHASTQEHAIRLIVENYPRRDTEAKYNKRYVAVELPYRADLPPDARKFKRFAIPGDSKELLNYCHKTDYTDMFNNWKNNQELIQSIETAISHISKGQPISEPKDHRELNEVIFSGARKVSEEDSESDEYDDEGFVLDKVSTENRMKQEFTNKECNNKYGTALEDLNLTGIKSESESEDENVTLECKSSPDCHMLMA